MSIADVEKCLLTKGNGTGIQDVSSLALNGQLKLPLLSPKVVLPLLSKFSSLETLDLSNNGLKSIPADLPLPRLRSLNVSSNDLVHLDCIKCLPNLVDLTWLPGNEGLGDHFQFLAVFYCKKLETVNGVSTEKCKAGLKTLRKALLQVVTEVHGMHNEEINARLHSDPAETHVLMEELWVLVKRRISHGKKPSSFLVLQEAVSREIVRKYLEEISRHPRPEPSVFETSERKKVVVRQRMCPPVDDYDPKYFLRCHSANERKSDKETKIWRAAFRPGSSILATCGGNYVCIIDCDTGQVKMKYKLLEEDFYSVAWANMKVAEPASAPSPTAWMLATSGFRGSVRLLRSDRMTCVLEIKHHKSHVNSLLFHPLDSHKLFTGSADLSVCLWKFDRLLMPSHRTNYTLLMKFIVPTNDEISTNDVLNLHVRGSHLLAATENDFVCWKTSNIPGDASSATHGSVKKAPKIVKQRKCEFQAELPYMATEYSVMDGMTPLGSTPFVASKYYKDGVISIWDFDKTVQDSLSHPSSEENVDCRLLTRLKWSDTDELYINIGSSPDGKLILAGDDNGTIWLYNLQHLKILGGSAEPVMKVGEEEELLQPSAVLEWPDVYAEDPNDSGLDLDFHEKKIMINYLTVSSDSSFIVGCTDVNIVCVWQRSEKGS